MQLLPRAPLRGGTNCLCSSLLPCLCVCVWITVRGAMLPPPPLAPSRSPPQERVENRQTLLRAGLRRVNERYLGDPMSGSLAYLPIASNPNNRILRFHPDRSFAFSTKSRVPYLTAVEVVDAPYMQLQSRCDVGGAS
jgi:hypothetical protein